MKRIQPVVLAAMIAWMVAAGCDNKPAPAKSPVATQPPADDNGLKTLFDGIPAEAQPRHLGDGVRLDRLNEWLKKQAGKKVSLNVGNLDVFVFQHEEGKKGYSANLAINGNVHFDQGATIATILFCSSSPLNSINQVRVDGLNEGDGEWLAGLSGQPAKVEFVVDSALFTGANLFFPQQLRIQISAISINGRAMPQIEKKQ
jgi:hypothetical protein